MLRGRGEGSYHLVGTEIHFRKMKKFRRWMVIDGCTTVRMSLVPLNCVLGMVNFMLCVSLVLALLLPLCCPGLV